MNRKQIEIDDFLVKATDIWKNQWMLITSGDFDQKKYNTMTIGWGSIGVMWNKPFVQAVVRPTRYTFDFTEKFNTFTLTAFSEKYKSALSLLGTKSGRDSDKILESGLTPIASGKVAAPGFEEAELIIECKKIYWDDFKPEKFVDKSIEKAYPLKDYHRIYFGEIVNILGTEKFNSK